MILIVTKEYFCIDVVGLCCCGCLVLVWALISVYMIVIGKVNMYSNAYILHSVIQQLMYKLIQNQFRLLCMLICNYIIIQELWLSALLKVG